MVFCHRQRKGLFCVTLRTDDLTNLGWEWNRGEEIPLSCITAVFLEERLLETEVCKGKGKERMHC